MKCEEVREMLPAVVGETDSLAVRRHLARCPECRADAARYETLLTTTAKLQTFVAEPPPGLMASLQAIPQARGRFDEVRTHVVRNRKAYAGGAAAMVATGLAGALVWRTRSRRLAHA
jgi:anti-sigma factor RsiW